MLGIIIAIVSGALMSIQGVFNTNFTKQTNVWFANSFIQMSAFLMCIFIDLSVILSFDRTKKECYSTKRLNPSKLLGIKKVKKVKP